MYHKSCTHPKIVTDGFCALRYEPVPVMQPEMFEPVRAVPKKSIPQALTSRADCCTEDIDLWQLPEDLRTRPTLMRFPILNS